MTEQNFKCNFIKFLNLIVEGRLSEYIQQNPKKINLSVGFPRNPRSSGFAVNSWKFLLQPDLPDTLIVNS